MKNLIFFGIVFSLMASCKKNWLDIKFDKQQAIPSTLRDFQKLLDDANGIMNQYDPYLGEVASDGHYIQEGAWLSNLRNEERNAYTWSNDYLYITSQFETAWVYPYKRIFQCNVVLDGLGKLQANDEQELKELKYIKGQALFHRAFVFYEIAQIWAPPYNESSASTDLGIPMRLESDVTLNSVRSSIKETYDRILGDLNEAKDLLPGISEYPTRPCAAAAYALLARINLLMGRFDESLTNSDKSLQINSKLKDYNSIQLSAPYIGIFNEEVLFHTTHTSSSATRTTLTANCRIETSLYSLYGTDDLRRSVFFKPNTDGSISFKGNYNNNDSKLFCGLATDEVYLIRAESYARKGNVASAMNDLNALLKKRYKNTIPYNEVVAVDSEDALRKILSERKKELVLRGLRWPDLRRLNNDVRFRDTLARTIGGKLYKLEPNSYKYTFPIPLDVIEATGMKQNAGW